jgi:Ion channel
MVLLSFFGARLKEAEEILVVAFVSSSALSRSSILALTINVDDYTPLHPTSASTLENFIMTLVGKVSEGAHTMVDDVAELIWMEEDTRKNDEIIQKQDRHNIFLVTKHISLLRHLASRFPRLYYFMADFILPLLALLGMAFAFGSAVAALESPGEIASNDAILAGVYSEYGSYVAEQESIRNTIMKVPGKCLTEYDQNVTVQELVSTPNRQNLMGALVQCATDEAEVKFPMLPLFPDFFVRAGPQLKFDWTTCNRTGYEVDVYARQYTQYVTDFTVDFLELWDGNDTEAIVNALSQATGAKTCSPHYIGGAWFWFTVMTTIGYGNAIPATVSARLLVYTCGFITVIGFIALNNTAGGFVVTVVDDLLLRLRLQRLTKGIFSVLLWLCLLILTMLALAGATKSWVQKRMNATVSLSDAYWYSFITSTTIGLGDINVPHSELEAVDMFSIPLIILCCLVVLGNFAGKLAHCYMIWFPADKTLESILAAGRTQDKSEWCETTGENLSLSARRTNIERRHSL